MIILGVDPGLRITGYGVIQNGGRQFKLLEAGVIRSKPKDGIGARLASLYKGIKGLISDMHPDVLVLEKLFAHYRHPTTALLMGHARGVICLASSEESVPLVSMASTRVKKAVISNGHASKQQVQRAVQYFLELKTLPQPTDVSDALAIALSYALTAGRHPGDRLQLALERKKAGV